jgi:proline iminopeptidase
LGYQVISFDVPGAYRSTRLPAGDMDEMIACADETLNRLGIQGPLPVIGHSMGGLAALGYAIERPGRVERLVLVTSLSGFPAAARWGFPGSAFKVYEPDFWRVIFWGMKLNAGRGTLALHKQLQNLMGVASFHNKELASQVEIQPDDAHKGVPIRTIWSQNMYTRLSYASRLDQVAVPTLIMAGRHDPEAPLDCSQELYDGIPNGTLFIFDHSGHAPFLEEPGLFERTLGTFLERYGKGR